MRTIAIIPARYASTRFPGKPLALLGGRPIVEHVWRAVAQMVAVDEALVATDDERIAACVDACAGRTAAMLTSTQHRSGTDRCAEVLRRLQERGEHYDVVVNVQGDEPFVDPQQIADLVRCFDDPQTEIATLATPIRSEEELLNPNNVKVVCDERGRALYFSRAAIPMLRDGSAEEAVQAGLCMKHVGIYAYRAATLLGIATLPQTTLEQAEKLEQLRWIGNGHSIAVCRTEHANIGIDTPADLQEAEAEWRRLHSEDKKQEAEQTKQE